MKFVLVVRVACILAAWLVVPGASAAAQSGSGNGALQGSVVDAGSKPVPGVAIEIRDLDTGYVRNAVTDPRGRFAAPAMPVGRYSLEATLQGFAPARRTDVTVTVGQTETIDLQLSVAGIAESVTVEGQASVDTRGAAVASRIDTRAIADLPVRGRNFTEFVQLTPAVVQESDRFGLVISGQRSINSNVAIDGADFNDPLQGNQRGGNESSFFFPQSAVREFQVVRSGAGAETGRTSAGFVNVVTRSGTNTVRGEALYFNRNRKLTSADAFDRKLNNQQNQFGGALGGPLAKDKAFLFGSFEQNFLRVPFVVKFQAQAPGVVVPADLTALEGEHHGTNNPTALFIRSDLRVTEHNRLDLQYTYSRLTGRNFNFDSPQISAAVTNNFTRRTESHAVKAGLLTVLSSTLLNEARVQYATDDRTEEPNTNLPQIVINGFGTIGGDSGRPRFFEAHRFQVTDSMTAVTGRHEIRAGIDANITPARQQRESNILGRYDFSSLANYNARIINRYRQTLPGFNPEDLFYDATQRELAVFVQDKVNLSTRVTMNAGLRWEGQWNPQPPRANPAFPETSRIPDDLRMWQPRLGLTWDAAGTGRTIVRANGGIYNARTPANLFQRVFTDNGITTVAVDSRTDATILSALTFPNALPALPAGLRVPVQRIFGFAADFQNPDTTAASATIDHRLNNTMQVSIGYIHNRTIHLQRRLDRNLFPPTIADTGLPVFPATRPNTTIAQLEVNESTAKSRYDALALTTSGRQRGVQWQVNYTYARNRDDDSNERNFSRQVTLNPFDLAAEWAPSKQDVRHNVNASAVAGLPFGFTVSGIVLARSGFPYTAIIGSDQQRDGNDDNDQAIINGRIAGRNTFRQPDFFNLDVRLTKAFRLRGSREVQFLVDVLNATRASNRNFGNDSVSVFGTPVSPVVTAGRPLFAPSTARFGGPRQVQLGMKVTF
ncbi:MAG TPA: TonB-dependent receptor [Vicinamibacterales bacterium]|nr:TonB-dependent receptor [Vicinamibacterales bacterium]